ncbi:TonB-dependent receptor [Hymenobacter psoromatis]|uniref:TonB-dependent receptor n=1 Tax=Hymenobacter psoromatis TaxID=1484116 RepID=UPI001CBBEC7A|nr:TonB-dependent receptor [Hymenobacter psoromatis]
MGISLANGRVAAGRGLLVLAWLLGGVPLGTQAQVEPTPACALNLAGRITDQRTGEPLPGTVLRLDETSAAEAADADGHYHFNQLCAGKYHLHATFVGYAEQVLTVTMRGSVTNLDIKLKAAAGQLGEVRVDGAKETRPLISQSQTTLTGRALQQTRGLNLAAALQGITGVYSIQTGPTIAKPVIHGLYGNRVLILNNGVRQEGQQWANDHAPEIDPFTATRLTVIKGAASIRYGADAIGGVVLVEPAALPDTAGVGGEVNLVGMTNGRLGAASAFVQGAIPADSAGGGGGRGRGLLHGLSYRVQGTLRRAGTARSANYYITNTGLQEQNYSLALNYHRGIIATELFFSRFDTKLGIFSGSETGSVTDLLSAIDRNRPLTPDVFTYTISRPYQAVVHQLFKTKATATLPGGGQVQATYARQTDARSEYGDQLPYNPALGDVPDLFLSLTSHTLDLAYLTPTTGPCSATAGFQGVTQANIREYQFLIPNFRNYGAGAYVLGKHRGERLTLEGGLRYDYRWLRAFFTDVSTGRITRPTTIYQAVTGTVGGLLDLGHGLTLSTNLATAWRPPTVNELYAAGVHQSAATYEIGDPNLTKEQAYNGSASLLYSGTKVESEVGGYVNYIRNYLYLAPAGRYIRTVRGAYPAFDYTQANALFKGLDARMSYRPVPRLTFSSSASLLWAYNESAHDYLIYAPPNRWQNGVRFSLGGDAGPLRQSYVGLNNQFVARQGCTPASGDYAPAPAAYDLWGAEAGTLLHAGHQLFDISLTASNLLNREYRDYLNRFRYYTADVGQNIQLRVRVPF